MDLWEGKSDGAAVVLEGTCCGVWSRVQGLMLLDVCVEAAVGSIGLCLNGQPPSLSIPPLFHARTLTEQVLVALPKHLLFFLLFCCTAAGKLVPLFITLGLIPVQFCAQQLLVNFAMTISQYRQFLYFRSTHSCLPWI